MKKPRFHKGLRHFFDTWNFLEFFRSKSAEKCKKKSDYVYLFTDIHNADNEKNDIFIKASDLAQAEQILIELYGINPDKVLLVDCDTI